MSNNSQTNINIGRAFIGLLFLFFGIVLTGIEIGIFDHALLNHLMRLWPLLLVCFGLAILAKKTVWKIVSICFFGALLLGGLWLLWQASFFSENTNVQTRDVEVLLDQHATEGNIQIHVKEADIRLSGPADSGVFTSGRIETKGVEHAWVTKTQNGTQQAGISLASVTSPFISTKGLIDLQLTSAIPLTFDIEASTANATLDFSSLKVKSLELAAGALNVSIAFGREWNTTDVMLEAGTATVELTAPEGVGVKLISKTGLAAKDLESLRQIDDSTFASEEFDAQEKKITVTIKSGVASIRFSRVSS